MEDCLSTEGCLNVTIGMESLLGDADRFGCFATALQQIGQGCSLGGKVGYEMSIIIIETQKTLQLFVGGGRSCLG